MSRNGRHRRNRRRLRVSEPASPSLAELVDSNPAAFSLPYELDASDAGPESWAPAEDTRFGGSPAGTPPGDPADSAGGGDPTEPSAEELLFNAACHAELHGEPLRARAIFRELLTVKPTHADARYRLARLLFGTESWEQALAEIDAAIELQSEQAPYHVTRGAILSAIGHFDDAETSLDRALALDSANVDAHFTLGLVKSRRGLWSEALPALRRSIELDSGNAPAYLHLGDALNHVDDLQGALQAYQHSVELTPTSAKALYGLGVVYDRLNQPDEAATMYRRSREMTAR